MSKELQSLLARYITDGAVGASLAFIRKGEAPAMVTAGLADLDKGLSVEASHLFKIGSCTKTFVTAALVRLAADGKVDLGAAVARWFPDLPGAKHISVRQLVDHRNGLPEFEFEVSMDFRRVWKPSELVDLAFKVGGQKPSGGSAVYNNTGYVLAGMLMEEIAGQPLGAYVRQVVLEPLGLRDTWSPSTEAFPAERLVRGYYHRPRPAAGAPTDIASGGEMWRMEGVLPYSDALQDSSDTFPYSAAFALGDMVSTPRDLVAFMNGLFAGKVFSQRWLEEMSGNRAPASFIGTRMRETGTGMFRSTYAGRSFSGHQGSIPGYVAVMQHDPESGLTIAMTSNVGSGNRLSFQANGLHAVVDEAIRLIQR
jgi:D-alanyl-D-alanine carboxypeptidase